MTAPAAVAVRSAHPWVLEAWESGLNAISRYSGWARDVLTSALASGFPPVFSDCGGHEGRLAGLAVPPGVQLPPGWQSEGGLAVPDPRTAAGRWVKAALDGADHPGSPWHWLPGLPARLAAAAEVPGWRAVLSPSRTILHAAWDPPGEGEPDWGPCDPRMWAPVTSDEDVAALAATAPGGCA
jgi:hypothetical protein